MKNRFSPFVLPTLAALCTLLPAQETTEAKAAKENAPAEKKATVVHHLRPSGQYADLAESGLDLTSALLGGGPGKTKSFYALVERIEELAEDDECKTILLDLTRMPGFNHPQVAELERTLRKVRSAGRKIYAFMENASTTEIQLASQCDEIILADMGAVDFASLAMGSMYMRDALDLLGIQMDVMRCGDFKGAAEPFMLSRMSAHLRNHYLAMLERMNQDVVRRVAEGRGLDRDRVRDFQAVRMFPAKKALAVGLVDRLVPWRGAEHAMRAVTGDDEVELKKVLKKKKRRGFNLMSVMQDLFKPKKKAEVEEETLVVLHLSGPISDGHEPMPGNMISGPAVATINELAANDKVKGVVVRINSPGGSATASEAILLALSELAAVKPVVCSMGDLAASGGYYITCFGRPIFAEAGTLTGSIGVVGVKPNVGPLMRRVGVHMELIALDESASMSSLDRPWTDAQKAQLQGYMNDVYDRFLDHVSRSRKMDRAEVEALAGGRVWSGDQAVDNKLVDHIGGLEAALDAVAKEAGVAPGYEVTHMPRPRSFMDMFAKQLMEARVALSELALPRELVAMVAGRPGALASSMLVLRDALQNPGAARAWLLMPAEVWVR